MSSQSNNRCFSHLVPRCWFHELCLHHVVGSMCYVCIMLLVPWVMLICPWILLISCWFWYQYLFRLGMKLVGESSHQQKCKITWKKEGLVQTFLETCIHETIKNGREGSSLSHSHGRMLEKYWKRNVTLMSINDKWKITTIILRENMQLGVNWKTKQAMSTIQ